MGNNPKTQKGKPKRKPFQQKRNDNMEDSRSYNSQSSKNRQPSDRGYSPKMDDRDTMVKSGYSNDPRWYDKCGILTKDATNISTLNPTGIPLDCGIVGPYTPAGIMRLDYIPHFGDVKDRTHPLNVVARQLYDYVNARNSRSSSYDPTDLMFYCIGVANAWSIHSWILRVVGMYNTFSRSNYYWWDPVLETMGVAPISSTNSINAWASLANYIALTLNTLAVPKDIAYFQRVQMLPSSVYIDSKSDKGSLYYFNPVQFLKYGYDSEGKSQLTGVVAPWNYSQGHELRNVTPDLIRNWFDTFVENLINDSDITFMKADIRKAFGDENTFMLPQIDEKFQHAFVYDDYVNVQVHNATIHNYLNVGNGFHYTLKQDMTNNSIVSNSTGDWISSQAPGAFADIPTISWRNSPFKENHLFDFPTDDVTNDLWSEATKLHAYWNNRGLQATTEVIVNDCCCSVVVNPDNSTTLRRIDACSMIGVVPSSLASQSAVDLKDTLLTIAVRLDNISKFAYGPMYYIVFSDTNAYAPPDKAFVVDDLTNYTTVSSSVLDKIRIPAQLSLFTAFTVK